MFFQSPKQQCHGAEGKQHTASGRGRPAGDWPPTGGVLNITAAVWNAGNKKRTQNVSEYMLVLALCLVTFCVSH